MSQDKDIFDASRDVSNILKSVDSAKRKMVINLALTSLDEGLSDTGGLNLVNSQKPDFQKYPEAPIQHGNSAVQQQATPINIKSFIEQKKPDSDIHLVTTIAYYYAFEAPEDERKESIGAKDLTEALRQSQQKRFNNPVQVLNNAKKRGLLDSAGRGQFKVNSVGENLVAMVLPDKHAKTSHSTKTISRKQIKKKKSSRKR